MGIILKQLLRKIATVEITGPNSSIRCCSPDSVERQSFYINIANVSFTLYFGVSSENKQRGDSSSIHACGKEEYTKQTHTYRRKPTDAPACQITPVSSIEADNSHATLLLPPGSACLLVPYRKRPPLRGAGVTTLLEVAILISELFSIPSHAAHLYVFCRFKYTSTS